jgi:endonuclease/exonuclease/phosphatase family metal-dependent hydrolase
MLNEIARERYSRLDSRDSACDITTLLVGDLNVAAGSEEYRAAMRALGDPTDILAADALTGTDAFTFPIGAYVSTTFEAFPLCLMGSESFGAYVPRTPTKRLDHALRFRKRGDERRAGEKKAASAAIVLAGLARGEDGAPLSDHAPIFAVVRR